jgi:hypothetical protein
MVGDSKLLLFVADGSRKCQEIDVGNVRFACHARTTSRILETIAYLQRRNEPIGSMAYDFRTMGDPRAFLIRYDAVVSRESSPPGANNGKGGRENASNFCSR